MISCEVVVVEVSAFEWLDVCSAPDSVDSSLAFAVLMGGGRCSAVMSREDEIVEAMFREELLNLVGEDVLVQVSSDQDLVALFNPFGEFNVEVFHEGLSGAGVSVFALKVLDVLLVN